MTLPDELYPIILSHIWDFALWRDARYVSRRWCTIIIETQPQLIWRFVRAGKLPNGTRHGYIHDGTCNSISFYGIFKYDKLIAHEAFGNYGIIFHKSFDTTGLIYFLECFVPESYKLIFLSQNYEEIFEFCINDMLDIYAIYIENMQLL